MGEIARELLVTLANVTLIADNLERKGYLRRVRASKDRRVVSVELTTKGRALRERISAAHRAKVAELMSGLSRPELMQSDGPDGKDQGKHPETSRTPALERQ